MSSIQNEGRCVSQVWRRRVSLYILYCYLLTIISLFSLGMKYDLFLHDSRAGKFLYVWESGFTIILLTFSIFFFRNKWRQFGICNMQICYTTVNLLFNYEPFFFSYDINVSFFSREIMGKFLNYLFIFFKFKNIFFSLFLGTIIDFGTRSRSWV